METRNRNLECDNWESGDPAANRCITCSHFLCEFCTQAHRRGRSTRLHTLKSLEEVVKMGSVAMEKPSVCEEHDGEVRKLFCETAKKLSAEIVVFWNIAITSAVLSRMLF